MVGWRDAQRGAELAAETDHPQKRDWEDRGSGIHVEDISSQSFGYTTGVTKRLIEIDDEKLEAVRSLLGTRTLKDTVGAALDEVLALDERRRALLAERGAEADALADSAKRQAAWR